MANRQPLKTFQKVEKMAGFSHDNQEPSPMKTGVSLLAKEIDTVHSFLKLHLQHRYDIS